MTEEIYQVKKYTAWRGRFDKQEIAIFNNNFHTNDLEEAENFIRKQRKWPFGWVTEFQGSGVKLLLKTQKGDQDLQEFYGKAIEGRRMRRMRRTQNLTRYEAYRIEEDGSMSKLPFEKREDAWGYAKETGNGFVVGFGPLHSCICHWFYQTHMLDQTMKKEKARLVRMFKPFKDQMPYQMQVLIKKQTH